MIEGSGESLTLLAALAAAGVAIVAGASGWAGVALGRRSEQRRQEDSAALPAFINGIDRDSHILLATVNDYAVYTLDREGIIQSWNGGANCIGGWLARDVTGQPQDILFLADDRCSGLPARLLQSVTGEQRLECEGWRLHRNGGRFWAQVVMTVQTGNDGQITGFACALRDTTSRRLQEDRIRFQAALLNRVRNAILAIDAHGCIVYMNAYAEELFRLPWKQAEGRHLRDLGLFADKAMPSPPPLPPSQPEDRQTSLHPGTRPGSPFRDSHRNRIEQEIEAFRHDGSPFPALCVTTISPDPSGEGYAEVLVIHDLTDLKKMQAALQHSAKLALLGRMSASLVHEISQPMNVIRLTAEGGLLKLSRQGLEQAELKERLQTIASQAARLFDTIDFMQLFSRRDNGGPLALAPVFDVCRSVRESAGVLRPSFQQAGIRLELELPDQACRARGRSRQFEQVLINLLNNALHAVAALPPAGREAGSAGAPAEGGPDQREPDQEGPDRPLRQVRLSLARADDSSGSLSLCVDDSGPGIPLALRQEIFEPFFTSKPAGEGTGLGLSISLGIVQAMNGTLEASDSPLGGARFELRLPEVTTPEATTPEAPPRLPGPAGKEAPAAGNDPDASLPVSAESPLPQETSLPDDATQMHGHILVVDDEELARKEIAGYLRSVGFQVSLAGGGHEALSILASCAGQEETAVPPVDVVITDLRMPEGNGFELIARLADDYPQIFTIVVTGQPLSERESLQSIGSNADAVLRKPVSLSVLTDHLSMLLLNNENLQE